LVRLGQFSSGYVRFRLVSSGYFTLGDDNSAYIRLGLFMSGYITLIHVMSDLAWLG